MENIVWHCPQVRHFLERTVKRQMEQPHLWHDLVCPVPKMNLIFSQPGNNVNQAMRDMIEATGLTGVTRFWTCTRNVKQTSENLWTLNNSYDVPHPNHLLVVEDGHFLMQMPDLYETSLDMANKLDFRFVIVVSTAVPKLNDFFWDQFDKNSTILYSLPTREKRQAILEYLWNTWTNHGHEVIMNSEDMQWLVDACDFCTATDILKFVHRVTRYVLGQEQSVTVDRKLLESRFVFPNVGLEQSPSICNEDRSTERHRYMSVIDAVDKNPKSAQDVAAYLDRQKQLKRRKLEEDKLEIK